MLKKVVNGINWRLVRGLAELQILTRTRYLMIILVPLLAGVWSAVRHHVNDSQSAMGDSMRLFEQHTEPFEQSRDELLTLLNSEGCGSAECESASAALKGVEQQSEELLGDVQKFYDNFVPGALLEARFPAVWAATFFAALFAIIGQLIYQLRAHDTLKKFTQDELVAFRKENYSKGGSYALSLAEEYVGKNSVAIDEEMASKFLVELKNCDDLDSPISKATFQKVFGLKRYIDNNRDELKQYDCDRVLRAIGKKLKDSACELSFIELGAVSEYQYFSHENKASAIASSLFYFLSVGVILYVVYVQSRLVIDAAGWP